MFQEPAPDREGEQLTSPRLGALANLLEQLLERDQRPPAILLILADIYQYGLRHATKATRFLREYLQTREDPEARARLRQLEGRSD